MNNFDFNNIPALWLLTIIPLVVGWFIYTRHQRKIYIKRLGDSKVVKKLELENSNFRPWLKFIILLVGFVLLIIGLADPQFATETTVSASENNEVIIALDISNSMLSTDNNFNLTRLEIAKNSISKLLENFKKEKAGLITFAGQAVMQIPITQDYSTFNLILKSVNPSYITAQGTAIADAISLACESFTPDKHNTKTIILISDGEDHEGDIEAAIENAKNKDIKIYTIGIGTSIGSPIVINGRPLKNEKGDIVISKLNEKILKQIASDTRADYLNLTTNNNALNIVFDKLNSVDEEGNVKIEKYEAKFHYFIFPALMFFILEFLILTRENRWVSKINIFEKREF